MDNFNSNTINDDVWLTPPSIVKNLGDFDLDPCTLPDGERPWDTASIHYSLPTDGLAENWLIKDNPRIWLNPPYGRETFKWLDKLADLNDDKKATGLGLIFARTETIGFHKTVWNRADAIFFFKGRLKFYTRDGREGGTANAPSCLVIYGEREIYKVTENIYNGLLKGRLVKLSY